MIISTIAIIANRDQISTYILQVIGNYPTSTGLSIYSILDLHRIQDIFVWTRKVYAASGFNQPLLLNASNIKDASDNCKNIGGLEYYGASWDPTLGQCLVDDTRLASISHLGTCLVLPSSRWIHQTPSSGLAPTSRPSLEASSVPRWDATMQMHECKEWQYEMPHIKVFKMSTRLHWTYISTTCYLIKHHTKAKQGEANNFLYKHRFWTAAPQSLVLTIPRVIGMQKVWS